MLKRNSLIVLLLSITVVSASKMRKGTVTTNENFIRILASNPRYFTDGAGKLWVPVEVNFPVFTKENDKEEDVFRRVDSLLRILSSNGVNAIRLWGPGAFFEIESQKIGHFDDSKFNRIDKFVEIAKKYNIRIKFSLETSTNFSDYRVSDRYHRFYRKLYEKRDGGPLSRFKGYIDSSAGRAMYFKRAKAILKRYRNEPTIYCWELWNEMNLISEGDWLAFTSYMIPRFKSVAPNQLVSQSLGSFDRLKYVPDYMAYGRLRANDIFEIHRYKDAAAPFEICRGEIYTMLNDAVEFGLANSSAVPVIINETGAVEANHTADSKLYAKDSKGFILHDALFSPFFSGSAGCGSMWSYWSYMEPLNLWSAYRDFCDITKDIDPVVQKLVPKVIRREGFIIYALVGPHEAYLWCRQNTVSIEDLLNGKGEEQAILSLPINDILGYRASKKIETFDPWTRVQASGRADIIKVAAFKHSLIVKITD